MNLISKEYLLLFNAVTDAEQSLDRLRQTLMEAQLRAEELFLEGSEEEDSPAGEKPLTFRPK